MTKKIHQGTIFYDLNLKNRHKKANRFKKITISAISIVTLFLIFFILDLTTKAIPALTQTYILVELNINEQSLQKPRSAVDRKLSRLISRSEFRDLTKRVKQEHTLMNTKTHLWLLADDQVDQYFKGHTNNLKDSQQKLLDVMHKNGKIDKRFNTTFFSRGDSKSPEKAGILSAVIGTILTMLITISIALPLGVMSAIYLEEFAQDNWFTRTIEININNLAAIPSILFGILGLAIFINFFHIPRSSPLVGGITLALIILPIIIVSARAALRAVPIKIKLAGYALGLSRWQVVRDIVLPNAFGGILTGSIIALAQAIGESAPLIIIGMVAFVPDHSLNLLDAATTMPAQIFTWAGMPESMYIEKTALGIMLLIMVMVILNSVAIILRKRYQK